MAQLLAARYLAAGWNVQSILAYVLVLALISVYRPWTREVEWETESGYYTMESLVS